ncbi:MAG TPA: hypothetical protein VK186_28370 [Candidatus Deferrimicrobium sp.]|nr:hypothetical protein [Candidatus Deferrimicrobium sp.]
MNSANEGLKTDTKKREQAHLEAEFTWKKREIISKLILTALGILITIVIQYQQCRQAHVAEDNKMKITGMIQENEKKFRQLSLKLSEGQLASMLIDRILSGELKERSVALIILEATAPGLHLRIVEALAVSSGDKQIKKLMTEELGDKGDANSLKLLSNVASGEIPNEEKSLAKQSMNKIIHRMLINAKGFYDVNYYPGAAEEFHKIAKYSTHLDNIDQQKLALAETHYILGHYREAAKNYLDVFKNLNLTFK